MILQSIKTSWEKRKTFESTAARLKKETWNMTEERAYGNETQGMESHADDDDYDEKQKTREEEARWKAF